ncbi:hypothetical protein M430DRAFT_21367 [Amorphotheca resinae ATCC 22711]|uniref:Autophagy-related protein 29 n=1 Tax=Amorphotheca resinae ATCC 22711 TaxID=857342 RepID=A0A2T3AUC7_AMORE|nr:hypothetical protein M430DRAFT_21367 [Amorphotheca resinae ATCC 22711]PSS12267.1 hypothetical protein M430DRAFT_21367 [Amorphotheca resinae ATCC 22711]
MSVDPSYTVIVRLPFPRGDFVDPPSVEWDAAKDKALWKILSKASKNSDIDWNELASKFEVSLAFLLQQAAWLYERQLLQVRAQMRKVGVSKSSAASPVPGSTSESAGGEMMRRTGSGGGRPQVYSSLSARRDSPIPKNETPVPNTSGRPPAPPISRNSSATTTVTARTAAAAAAQLHQPSKPSSQIETQPQPRRSPQPEPSSSSSSDSDSSSSSSLAQSRLFRRPQKFSSSHKGKLGLSPDAEDDDDDDDEDEEPAFLPVTSTSTHDPSATLRGDPRNLARRERIPARGKPAEVSQTSDSSASSASPAIPRADEKTGPPPFSQRRGGPSPLSPTRSAALAGRSPGMRGKGREGSESSPSMGSSFSDLDDASVTQSALEEALASNMQAAGGMASRMSSISQALRSKYL